MKIKLKEHYRDAHVYFAAGQVVDASDTLAKWLLENKKAIPFIEEARHLDVEPQFEQAEEPPQTKSLKPRKRGRGET